MRPLAAALLAVLLTTMLVGPASAADGSLIIDRGRADRAVPGLPAAAKPDEKPPTPEDKLSKVSPFILKGVRIGKSTLAPAFLTAATQGFIGRMTDATAIHAIADAVSAAYAAHGDIALYTVTVPDQDFKDGVLSLTIYEGYIAHVTLDGDTAGDVGRVAALAHKLTLERPLRRTTLERYLSLMRDLPGLTLKVQMLKGDAPGAVLLALTLTQKRYDLAFSLNDAANPLLGRIQGEADLSLYNLLREGERTKLGFGTSTVFSRYQYYSLADSEPLDDEGTRADFAYGYLRTKLAAPPLSGTAQTLQLAFSHPFIRGYAQNLLLGVGLDGLNSGNALIGQTLSDDAVRAARLTARYSITDGDDAVALHASLSEGLDILGAHLTDAADKNFKKLDGGAQYNRVLAPGWVLRLSVAGQLAFNALPLSELYALGGAQFGRAYLGVSALGDSALAGSAELGYSPSGLGDLLTGVELFGFADDGVTWYRPRPGYLPSDSQLASAGVGLRLPVMAKTKVELQVADGIAAHAPGVEAGKWRFLFALTAVQ